jgi:hypothetical protein
MAAVLNAAAKGITKSGIAISQNSASPWIARSCLAIPQTAYSNKPAYRIIADSDQAVSIGDDGTDKREIYQ